jgi:hypothetical protein
MPPISHNPTWQDSFQTSSQDEVAEICRDLNITHAWIGNVLQVSRANLNDALLAAAAE